MRLRDTHRLGGMPQSSPAKRSLDQDSSASSLHCAALLPLTAEASRLKRKTSSEAPFTAPLYTSYMDEQKDQLQADSENGRASDLESH